MLESLKLMTQSTNLGSEGFRVLVSELATNSVPTLRSLELECGWSQLDVIFSDFQSELSRFTKLQ